MQPTAKNVSDYIDGLPPERKQVMEQLRQSILKSLPPGFEECMSYGMIGYVVPHSIFPSGYHCDPKLPLPFLNIASQKNFIAIYHMGMYADPALLEWFVQSYPQHAKAKLDMGKSCVRFKKLDDIPYELIAQLCAKITVDQWIALYQSAFKR